MEKNNFAPLIFFFSKIYDIGKQILQVKQFVIKALEDCQN